MSGRWTLVTIACAAALVPGCEGSGEGRADEGAPAESVTVIHAGSGSAPDAGAPPAPEYETNDLPEPDFLGKTLEEQRAALVRRMIALGAANQAEGAALAEIMAKSKKLGQGNPVATRHPMTRAQCIQIRKAMKVQDEKKPACGAPFMVPIYDPASEKEADAKVCIDRFEFPGLPCDYPVTWVTTNQGEAMCKAIGKRLCDAHEWEGACAGAVLPAEKEYAFGMPRSVIRGLHNLHREIRWAYGAQKDHAKCAMSGNLSKGCESSSWRKCGSNTFPAGSFPECKSPFGVYDQHGNAAEHMALPLKEEKLGRLGGFGEPEMKGSWFIFGRQEAHVDDCRWRAPAWHDNEGKNHANYHLSFRCCKDIGKGEGAR